MISAPSRSTTGVERTLSQQFPDYMARHPTEALEPDEELLLMEMSFECAVSSLRTRTPSHRAFVESCDPRETYAYMKSMLQYLQWQDGGRRKRPWIMKSPVHIGHLETLLKFFPDATIVHCHRDPREVIPSFASLIESARRIGSDDIDLQEVGQDTLEFWATQLDRNLEARQRVNTSRIIDVSYERIRDDALGVIAEVYATAGRELTPETEAAFIAYESRRPQGHFGRHEYTAEQFGLDLTRIDERFREYRDRFINPEVRA